MLDPAVTKSDRPICKKVPTPFKSISTSQHLVLRGIAQGRDDTGLQSPLGNQQVTMQAVDDIGQKSLVGQLRVIEYSLYHDSAGRTLQGHQALASDTRRGQRNLIRAQSLTEQ